MHKLAQSVLGHIRKTDLLRPGDRLGVAVSGGADSVALLRLMIELRSKLGIVLSVIHLNHKLRGAESDADEQFVRELAATHELEFICESRDVKAYATEKKLGLEAAAREVRYDFFGKLLSRNLDRIATAHTLDDQAETVLLKLARGAGTRGLAGIYPRVAISPFGSAQGWLSPSAVSEAQKSGQWPVISGCSTKFIVRPLLGTKRKDLEVYLAGIGQGWREDSSNRDLRHTRNRIRHGILPGLARHVNPSVCETLAEAAEIARAEEEYWSDEVARLLPQVWSRTERGRALNWKRLQEFPLALQRRLIRMAAMSLGLGLEFRHVEEVLALKAEGERSALPENWLALRHAGELCFELPSAKSSDYEYPLPVPGKTRVTEANFTVEALLVPSRGCVPNSYNPEHLVDSKFVQRELIVRNWRPGERFWPPHTKGPRKIKGLLQDEHITGEEKKLWPVIVSGEEIVWVRRLGVRRGFQPKDNKGVLIRESEPA